MAHKPHLLEYFPVFIGSKKSIIHYSCNSPPHEVLNKHNIEPLGQDFESDSREVLQIPLSVYKKAGFSELNNKSILQLNLEKVMRDLK